MFLVRNSRVVLWLPHLLVEMVMRSGGLRSKILEILSESVNTHLTNSLAITATYIYATFLGFFFTCYKNVVPLIELGISDFLVKLSI
jgi:hypothetical protein